MIVICAPLRDSILLKTPILIYLFMPRHIQINNDQAQCLRKYKYWNGIGGIQTYNQLIWKVYRRAIASDLLSFLFKIYVTSFSSISYWSNNEYWTQKHTQSDNIHSIPLDVHVEKKSVHFTTTTEKWIV